jgi:DHA2 family metal-tetracycline-proton antiporter-like MFS transporter
VSHDAIAPHPAVTPTAVLLGLLIAPSALGISTTAVALPTISEDLGLSHPEAAWVLAGYVLAQATWVALFGRIADMRGTRAALLIGAGMIGVGTVLAAFSGSFALLLAGRMLQGAGVAASPVVGFSIAASLYEDAERARAIGLISAVLAVLSGSGSLIGGLLTDGLSWRAVVLVPALTLPATAAALHLASRSGAGTGRLDGVGAGLVVVLASCVVLLLETPSIDFATSVLVALGAIAAAAAALLARRVRTLPDGFIPAVVVRSRRYVLGALAALTLFGGYLAMLFAAPLLLLQDHDWTPTHVGLVLLPAAAMGAVSARWLGHVVRLDPFRLTAVLALVSAAGLLLAGIADGAPALTTLALGMTIVGFMAAQVILVNRVPLVLAPEVRSIATGVFILVFLIGGAVGTASVAGLTDPLGLAGAVACVAALPAAGSVLSLAAGA